MAHDVQGIPKIVSSQGSGVGASKPASPSSPSSSSPSSSSSSSSPSLPPSPSSPSSSSSPSPSSPSSRGYMHPNGLVSEKTGMGNIVLSHLLHHVKPTPRVTESRLTAGRDFSSFSFIPCRAHQLYDSFPWVSADILRLLAEAVLPFPG
ncbi:PREDICTED: cell wall integrity and stress response component 1-like [Chrysochloris asiatica]|uniref:Cell wall integrity and stress response component 1-like n=1 Tax=Chrysochloris asiatica TaxID=185453 RepID=A0A9B0WN95_CHRAS|nr:PREDICTED: cell wall integrity and stress response component 1-like [Chrysochloris asiatica]